MLKINILASFFIKAGLKRINSKFYDILLNQLKQFEKTFGDFIIAQCSSSPNLSYAELIRNITDHSDCQEVSIDSFNYSIIPNYDLYNINGDANCPIFGIDSKGIKTTEHRFMFTKTYRRLEMINNLKRKKQPPYNSLYIYGHSLNQQDYSYFFPIFDYLDIQSVNSDSELIFAFTDYSENPEGREKIIQGLTTGISGLLAAYEDYKHKTDEHRLLDILSFQNRIKIKEIK